VLALGRDLAADLFQEGVCARAAIAANDVNGLRRTEVGVQLPQQVQRTRINGDGLVAAPVAHQVIDLLHGGRNVASVLHVSDRQILFGVDVIKRNRARFAARLRRRGIGKRPGTKGQCSGNGH
jgi:hypothetical protein